MKKIYDKRKLQEIEGVDGTEGFPILFFMFQEEGREGSFNGDIKMLEDIQKIIYMY